jgi:hypothetical protein
MKQLLFALLPLLFLASCATTPFPANPPASALSELLQRGVPSTTVKRIQHGRILDFDDILALVKANVSGKAVVAYLKSTRAPYRFTTAQLEQLSDAGAGSTLVNYLGQSVGYYEASKRNQLGGLKWDKDPYFNDPLYWGVPPFNYGFPGEWSYPGFLFAPF